MKRQVLILLTVLTLILFASGCEKTYDVITDKPLNYSSEQVEKMFAENLKLFNSVCKILNKNKAFYNSRKIKHTDSAAISHFSDEPKKYFSVEEWGIIKSFFIKTKPYEIYLQEAGVIDFVYIDEKNEGCYSYYNFSSNESDIKYYFDGYDSYKKVSRKWYTGHMKA